MRSKLLASSVLCVALMALSPISTSVFAAQPPDGETIDPGAAKPAAPVVVPMPAESSMSIDEAQRRVALQKLLSDRSARANDRKDEMTAVEAFYKQREFQQLWSAGGTPTPQAFAVEAHLKAAGTLGLDPADYLAPDLPPFLDADNAAAAELALTNSVLTFVRHASFGRVSYTRVSGSILYPTPAFDAVAVLSQLAASKDMAPR